MQVLDSECARSSKFTFDYKYIINGFQHHKESARAEGMSVNISVDVTNVGEEMGGCTVELKVNGHVVNSVEIPPFGGGVTATQFFELKRGEGYYEVAVNGLTGSFAVFIPASERAESTMIAIVIIVCIVAISVWRLGGFTRARLLLL